MSPDSDSTGSSSQTSVPLLSSTPAAALPSAQSVLSALRENLSNAKRSWLCTVVKTVGAAPRPLGSMLCLDEHGHSVGSLSGGCIEDDLLERLAGGTLSDSYPAILPYGISPEQNERLGLPCGGHMEVLVEQFEPDDALKLQALKQVLEAIVARKNCRRQLDLNSGAWQVSAIEKSSSLLLGDGRLQQDFGPEMRLLLIGANALARCLAYLALPMEYRVAVADPRDFAQAEWDVDGVPCLSGMPDDVVADFAVDADTVIITLTHDPRIDDMALMAALKTDAFYIGALGSSRTSAKRRERLLQLDISEAELEKLHAPVGLAIGSKTPMEIAVAIMAELTQLRVAAKAAV